MTRKEVLVQLGATFGAATVFWLALFRAYAPPDPDSAGFFAAWCSLIGVLFGAILVFLTARGKDDVRLMLALAVGAAVIGGVGLSRYENARHERVAEIREFGGAKTDYVVGNRLTEVGFAAVMARGLCDRRALQDPEAGVVSWSCARRAADALSAEKHRLFDEEAREESLSVLVGWYRTAAFAFIFMLALLVDFGMKNLKARRARGTRQPAPENAAGH